MSVWETVAPLVCHKKELAGHAFCGPIGASAKKNLEMLEAELEQWDYSLKQAQTVAQFSPYAHKLEELRGKIAQARSVISKPLSYAATFQDGKDLLSAIREIGRYDPRANPVGAARAYGKAMKSFGKLIEKLPPPANAVGTLIAEMGEIFHKVVGDIVPKTRQTHKNVSDKFIQGGTVIPGFGD